MWSTMPSESKAKTKWERREIHLALLVLVISLVAYAFSFGGQGPTVTINDQVFNVDLADDAAERKAGLSGRPAIADNEAMLFVFPESDDYGIWMKDMNFSIDILWLDVNNRVIHIEERISPNTYPETYYPNVPAKYVLEIYSGQANAQGIAVGDQMVLDI